MKFCHIYRSLRCQRLDELAEALSEWEQEEWEPYGEVITVPGVHGQYYEILIRRGTFVEDKPPVKPRKQQ